ncbi:MAG: methionyl-tRNA formyltransferase [Bacteriovoracales bacterium]|nr:methionyl-tRNA formyltransferase [Bacteriovoracales bacterium]
MIKTVFFGTPDICLPTLKTLHQNPHIQLDFIVSMPPRKAGRGMKMKDPPVALFAKDQNIPLLQTNGINKEEEFLSQLEKEGLDLIVVFAFSQFLSSRILSLPKWGCFNIHTSLLPKYRGAAPIQYALLNGDTQTGVSIQKMVKKMDAGDIALSKTVPIHREDNGSSLYEKLKEESALAMDSFVDQITSDSLPLTPQDEAHASFAPTLSKRDGHLQFASHTLVEIENRLRAFDPWPGTFCYLNKKLLKVFELAPAPSHSSLSPGECSAKHGFLLVGAKDQTVRLKTVQLEGKKVCSDTELLNGFRHKIHLS